MKNYNHKKFSSNKARQRGLQWQRVIQALISPAPSDLEEAGKKLEEANEKLKKASNNIDDKKASEINDASIELKKMGFNTREVIIRSLSKFGNKNIKKIASEPQLESDLKLIVVEEFLKEAKNLRLLNIEDYEINKIARECQNKDYSIEKFAGFWGGLWKGVKTVAKLPLKILKPVLRILPGVGLVAAIYLCVTGINGYIKASKHIFDELNASKYGINKKDIFMPGSLSSKTGKAIRDSLKVNVTDDNFPSCAINNKCHWFYTPEKAEELSIQEFGKDFVSTMKSLKDLFTGEVIQQKLPNTLESGKKRSFSRTTANPSEMENLAKLSKSVEAMIIHATNAIDGIVSSITSLIAIIGSIATLGIGAGPLALIDFVVSSASAAGAWAARKALAKDIRASMEVIMETAQEGFQRNFMLTLSPSVNELKEMKRNAEKRNSEKEIINSDDKKDKDNIILLKVDDEEEMLKAARLLRRQRIKSLLV